MWLFFCRYGAHRAPNGTLLHLFANIPLCLARNAGPISSFRFRGSPGIDSAASRMHYLAGSTTNRGEITPRQRPGGILMKLTLVQSTKYLLLTLFTLALLGCGGEDSGSGAESALGGVGDALGDVADATSDAVKGATDAVADTVSDAANATADFVEDTAQSVAEAGEEMGDAMGDKLEAGKNKLAEETQQAEKDLGDQLNSLGQ